MNINASLFVQMVVFFLGAWITMKYIWPPLINAIEERQKKIADGLAAANKGEKALAVAAEQSKAIEAEARGRATSLVSDGEKRAQAVIDAAKAQAQVEADRIIEAAKAEAAQEMQRAREQLRGEVAALAVAGAEQILAREVDKTVHAQLLEQLKAKL
ncbi:MAG: F0F1 ATP synthase subunit B [Sutterella parvirubra]|jgi:F-type H+-transporting ATPase subunit b|uniref:ATP synthase subunit b n=1 Tax=Sutterella parvirubra YIT 11816 TaxID=762967 RepID=H3KBC1_9BURK|nr:F0F1 ATP synthase subunit B [Sutterella parvirubra]EHY32554.1 ATP synthase F0, B subunit [Sutterella parvirubra YIT 11816]MCI7709421.1 F0F1 ATP synthase subunit B [Sutterella parvirubra]MDR3771165.1 F0F1 ATP synthase subunit B [Sutterella sp.]MDY5200552.1 F0F1 ATP synthase subunit B [Sutterella parvirubra]